MSISVIMKVDRNDAALDSDGGRLIMSIAPEGDRSQIRHAEILADFVADEPLMQFPSGRELRGARNLRWKVTIEPADDVVPEEQAS